MKGGKKLFFRLSLLELSYFPAEINMEWKWLKSSPDAFKRFKIGLGRGWKIKNFKYNWERDKKYNFEIVDLLCEESCWSTHSRLDIQISSFDLIKRIIMSGQPGPLKFILWSELEDWDISDFRPWSANILKYPVLYGVRKKLATNNIRDWVEEEDAIEVYKNDPSPRICVIEQGGTLAVAWYNDFLNSSWVFHIHYMRSAFDLENWSFCQEYIGFLAKHDALYMILYDKYVLSEMNNIKNFIEVISGKYTSEDLEREKHADPKRYELWKKHFGEIND